MRGRARVFTTDQSHLAKYLTTLGVGLVAGGGLMTRWMLEASDTLRIPVSDLRTYTPAAQRTIQSKQSAADTVQQILPVLAAITSIVGLLLIAAGIGWWLRVQRTLDETAGYERDRMGLELKALSRAEEERKYRIEAALSAVEDEASQAADSHAGPTEIEPELPAEREKRVSILSQSIRNVEELFAHRISMVSGRGLQRNIRTVSGLEVDAALIRAKGSRDPSFVFDIKYITNMGGVAIAAGRAALTARSAATEMEARLGTPVKPVAVLITNEPVTAVRKKNSEDQASSLGARLAWFTLDELKNISESEFADRLGL
jgi:hypothetical protein